MLINVTCNEFLTAYFIFLKILIHLWNKFINVFFNIDRYFISVALFYYFSLKFMTIILFLWVIYNHNQ